MTDVPKKQITGWGNYPVIGARHLGFGSDAELAQQVQSVPHVIARGMGRSYGDSSLGDHVVSMLRYNRMLGFDETDGTLWCEAGTTLEEILAVFVPRGWFLPVTPGTKYVTVGGAIAADVHGKNHHVEGTFGNHVVHMDILLPDGEVRRCGPHENRELFDMTCGGMGWTGIILRAAFRLKPITSAYIRQKTARYGNLDAIMDAFDASARITYSVAWIDGLAKGKKLGRSVLFTGEHADAGELTGAMAKSPLNLKPKGKLTMPFNFPSFTLNALTVRAFNMVYYGLAPGKPRDSYVNYDTFFYPLDHILHWNRLYGKKGFTQYQFVLPLESSREGMAAILNRIARSGEGSFLSVLKLFGEQEGILSFPRKGYTLALDFPIKATTFALLDELDRMVLDYGGRIYLAKDVRMSAETFRQGYERIDTFLSQKAVLDPQARWQSLQSRRLGVDS